MGLRAALDSWRLDDLDLEKEREKRDRRLYLLFFATGEEVRSADVAAAAD